MLSEKDRARQERIEREKDDGFSRWLGQPETKLMLSLVPSSDNPDALATLLRSAFNAGGPCGQAVMMIEMLDGLLSRKP